MVPCFEKWVVSSCINIRWKGYDVGSNRDVNLDVPHGRKIEHIAWLERDFDRLCQLGVLRLEVIGLWIPGSKGNRVIDLIKF